MTINDNFEVVDDADIPADSSSNIIVTFSNNTPTPAVTQTINDGDAPTGPETGQYIQNINTEFAKLRAQVEDLRATLGS